MLLRIFLICVCLGVVRDCGAKDLAILIGVTHYDSTEFTDDRDFLYVRNDVEVLKSRLLEGTRDSFEVISLMDENTVLSKIRSTLQDMLSPANCRGREKVLVFFSGHGSVSAQDSEKVLLAVRDTDPKNEGSFLSAQEIRELLGNCGAKNTLLLLDSCHAGGVKSLKEPLQRITSVPGVITLASSRVFENSGTWAEKSMSNFSYWINEGLKGYSDLDKNGSVSTEELTKYVSENMARKTSLQTPVLVMSDQTPHFELFTPRARTIYSVLDDMAEQIILYSSLRNISDLQMKAFRPVSASGTTRSADFRPEDFNQMKKLSFFCSEELKRRVTLKSTGKLRVSDEKTPESAVLSCELKRNEKFYFLTCSLMFPDVVPGSADADSKNNVSRKSERMENPAPEITISQRVLVKASYETWEPREVPQNYIPARMMIEVKNRNGVFQQRTIEKIDGQYYIVLNEGEVYRILLHRFRQPGSDPIRLGARVFVDGKSTLPQSLSEVCASKFQIVGSVDTGEKEPEVSSVEAGSSSSGILSSGTPVEAPCMPMDVTGFYVLGGKSAEDPFNYDAYHRFHGFLKSTGNHAAYREFLVAASAETAGQEEHIGIINVAIYELEKSECTRGTVEGNWGETSAPVVDGLAIKKLLQMIVLRYVPENEMRMIRQGKSVKSNFWAE
ncbi:MAG: caspase family protein [Planctomycetia bacterium]|nr:caspase family protein [Planctomycetia bacterium]